MERPEWFACASKSARIGTTMTERISARAKVKRAVFIFLTPNEAAGAMAPPLAESTVRLSFFVRHGRPQTDIYLQHALTLLVDTQASHARDRAVLDVLPDLDPHQRLPVGQRLFVLPRGVAADGVRQRYNSRNSSRIGRVRLFRLCQRLVFVLAYGRPCNDDFRRGRRISRYHASRWRGDDRLFRVVLAHD